MRYTIGTGCSGGSLAQQQIANAYPGIYQGILPTCSFPDAWSTATQFLDYHQSLRYFKDPSLWAPGVVWSPTQMADVQGHITIANAEVSDSAQFHVVIPTDPCKGVTDEQRYSKANPGGVRCDIQDAAINLFGPRLARCLERPREKQIGRGFAGVPIDNVGVQYGLASLKGGRITPAQFVDLNQKMGGLNSDVEHTDARMRADQPALPNAYRTGLINEGNNLDRTAMIDCRGPDPGAFHDAYRAFAVRARLDREHGGHANQLIWEGALLIAGDKHCERNSFVAMDRWLAAVEKDGKPGKLAEKIIRDKPSDLTDRCYSGSGVKLGDDLCGDAVVGVYGTPRMVAGDAITTDTNKCQLKPLDRGDYGTVGALFTDEQIDALKAGLPGGRVRLLQARRGPAEDDPVADLPGRQGRRRLRRQATGRLPTEPPGEGPASGLGVVGGARVRLELQGDERVDHRRPHGVGDGRGEPGRFRPFPDALHDEPPALRPADLRRAALERGRLLHQALAPGEEGDQLVVDGVDRRPHLLE